MKNAQRTRGGYGLIEVILAMAVIAIVGYNVVTVMNAAARSSSTDTSASIREDHAQTVLKRIAQAIMSADRDSLDPAMAAPLSTDDLGYRVQLGVENGQIVWDDPEMIGLEDPVNQVFWSQNPGAEAERRVVWTSLVRPFLEGEEMNGVDDNGNGLIDEKGLNFVVDRNAITIRLTMERRASDGRIVSYSVERTVTCRNPRVGG